MADYGPGDNWDGYVAEREALVDWLVGPRDAQSRRHHRRLPRELGPQRAAEAPRARRAPGRHGVHGHVDLDRRRPPAPSTRFHDDPDNPHIVFRNNNRGYVRCTLTADTWTSDYRIVPTVRERGVPATTLASFVVENGRAGAQLAATPAV